MAQNQVDDSDVPLLEDHIPEDGDRPLEDPKPKYKYRYYTLPGLRYTNVVKTIVFIDVIFSLTIWLLGEFVQGDIPIWFCIMK